MSRAIILNMYSDIMPVYPYNHAKMPFELKVKWLMTNYTRVKLSSNLTIHLCIHGTIQTYWLMGHSSFMQHMLTYKIIFCIQLILTIFFHPSG